MAPFLAGLLTSGISSILGIGSNLVSNSLNKKGLKEQYEYNKELTQQQYQNQIDFWNMNNEYNTPANQMQRYREAGINPYEALGHSNTSSYGSVMVNPPDAPNYGASDAASVRGSLSDSLSIMKTLTDINNIKSQTNLNDSRSVLNKAITYVQDSIKRLNDTKSDLNTIDAQTRSVLNDSNIQLLQARSLTEGERLGLLKTQIVLNGQKIELFPFQKEQIETQIKLLKTRTKLSESQIGLLAAQTYLTQLRAANQAIENEYADSYYFYRNENLTVNYQKSAETLEHVINKYKWDSLSAEQQFNILRKNSNWRDVEKGTQIGTSILGTLFKFIK